MNFRNRRPDDLDLNITPLIDVVFLLLIFFMVTTTFEHDSEISITLPEASRETTETDNNKVEVDIDEQGRIYVNSQSLVNTQPDTIQEALDEAVSQLDDTRQQPSIVINADAKTSHQSVISVMDAARQLGLRRITFATRIDQTE